jgi:hypothetical protein
LLSNKGNPSTNIHVLIEEINRVITWHRLPNSVLLF